MYIVHCSIRIKVNWLTWYNGIENVICITMWDLYCWTIHVLHVQQPNQIGIFIWTLLSLRIRNQLQWEKVMKESKYDCVIRFILISVLIVNRKCLSTRWHETKQMCSNERFLLSIFVDVNCENSICVLTFMSFKILFMLAQNNAFVSSNFKWTVAYISSICKNLEKLVRISYTMVLIRYKIV